MYSKLFKLVYFDSNRTVALRKGGPRKKDRFFANFQKNVHITCLISLLQNALVLDQEGKPVSCVKVDYESKQKNKDVFEPINSILYTMCPKKVSHVQIGIT